VPHDNSVFHSVLKQVAWDEFERLVEAHDSDRRVRRLTSKGQLVALLYGQLAGAGTLREIVTGLSSHERRLYHLGMGKVCRSTLSDANNLRPSALFADLLNAMIGRAHRGLRRKVAEAVYLIDSTGLPLNNLSQDWARFSAGVCGAKLHVVYDANAEQPIYAAVTPARVNDITVAQAMPIEAGATYVFDLGYYDYAWWAKMSAAGCRIVTRFKSNTPLNDITENPLPEASAILSDRTGSLPAKRAAGKPNPFQGQVREIQVRTETGKVLRILSNDLDASAQQIADLYKRRWTIELFFRWVKQTLKIRHFVGISENAVRIQIAVALIAFLLVRLLQNAVKDHHSPLTFARLLRVNLMHRRPVNRLDQPEPPAPGPQDQMVILWA
jgi:hypothetical protein